MQTIEILILILVLTIIPSIAINNIAINEKVKLIEVRKAEYEQGYDTGALCGSKFGYDSCMELLKRIKL